MKYIKNTEDKNQLRLYFGTLHPGIKILYL